MGGVVADQRQRARVVAGEDLDAAGAADRVGATAFLASDFEMAAATSRPLTDAPNGRAAPSGKTSSIMSVLVCSLAAYERR
jgi:hypothetical protein